MYGIVRRRFSRLLAAGFLGVSLLWGGSNCQAYFNGALAYNENYRSVDAKMRVEKYIDLSSINKSVDNAQWLIFSVQLLAADEDADVVRVSSTPARFKINKESREAWVEANNGWRYLDLNKSPFGYEISSFNMVNLCYQHLFADFLNDSTGTTAEILKSYKGE